MKKKNYKIRQVETDGKLYYFYEMEWNLYGKRERFYAPTEEELWEKLQKIEDERLKYLLKSAPKNPVLNDYINLYFKGHMSIGNPMELKSDLLFIRAMTSDSEINRNITELSTEDIQNYYTKLTAQYSIKEISRLHEILLEVFQSFNHVGIQTIDLSKVQLPDNETASGKSRKALLSKQEMENLLLQCQTSRNSNNNNAWVIIFALYTGICLNDIFEIRNSDVRLDDCTVIVSGNAVPMCSECTEWLKERISDKAVESDVLYKNPEQKENIIRNYLQSNPDEYLFTNKNRSQTTYYPTTRFLKNIAEKCGLSRNVTPLVLHHSSLADALKNGATVEELKAVYGHDDKFYNSLIKI